MFTTHCNLHSFPHSKTRELAQTLAPWGVISGHQKQTPDVERGDKCKTYWFYASLRLIVGVRIFMSQSKKEITTLKTTETSFFFLVFCKALFTHVVPLFQTEHKPTSRGLFHKLKRLFQLHELGQNKAVCRTTLTDVQQQLNIRYKQRLLKFGLWRLQLTSLALTPLILLSELYQNILILGGYHVFMHLYMQYLSFIKTNDNTMLE